MSGAMDKAEKMGSKINRVWHLCHLAAAHAQAGDVLVGYTLLDEAIHAGEKAGVRNFEAELYRLQGEMLVDLGERDKAVASLQRALGVARDHQARWWELRAAASLARLRRDQGKFVDAHKVLVRVFSWFTEGLDLPDLKGSRALLDTLRTSYMGSTR
jgi:predicted ATPase